MYCEILVGALVLRFVRRVRASNVGEWRRRGKKKKNECRGRFLSHGVYCFLFGIGSEVSDLGRGRGYTGIFLGGLMRWYDGAIQYGGVMYETTYWVS